MRQRYTDKKENRVDFVLRSYGMPIGLVVIIMLLPPVIISTLYFFNIFNNHINIELNLLVSTLTTLYIVYSVKYFRRTLNIIEFQNVIFANALKHNTEFCFILQARGNIIYTDIRFFERFGNDINNTLTLDDVFEAGNIPETDKKLFYKALKNNSFAQTYMYLRKKDEISNFSLSRITINATDVLNLSLSPIVRPSGYFLLTAIRISKEQVYEELIKKHNIGNYIANTRGTILFASKNFLRLFELNELENGSSINDFILQSQYNKQGGKEILFSTFNGIPFRAIMSTAVFCDKYNHNYVYGFITSVESNIIDYQLHPCFVNSPVAIAQCDANGNFIKKNVALLKLTGSKEDSIFTLVPSKHCKKIREYLSSKRLNNASFDVQLNNCKNVNMLFNKFLHNKAILILCYFIDNTEHKNLAMDFEHYQKMQAIGQLAGGIAHDFNNILTGITGFCDLLLDQHPAGDPSFSDIIQIQKNAKRGSDLVKQLLAFSRKQTLQTQIIDINSIIANLYEMIKRLIGENIKFTAYYGSNLGSIIADQGQLEQVIINLVINAGVAMEQGGELIIKTYNISIDSSDYTFRNMFSPDKEAIEHGNYVVTEVADTGYGIKNGIIKKIFDPFFSTKNGGSSGVGESKGNGTGLGLSTVYGIVKQTNGYIFVNTKVGCGTTFFILLPSVYVEDKAIIEKDNNKFENPLFSNFKNSGVILLVEDEDSVREFITRALNKMGFKVIETGVGSEALKIINDKDERIDLIITDVVMPGISGLEIVKEAFTHRSGVDVIFMSGYAEDTFTKANDFNIEDFHFLPKPFTSSELGMKVKDILARKSMET